MDTLNEGESVDGINYDAVGEEMAKNLDVIIPEIGKLREELYSNSDIKDPILAEIWSVRKQPKKQDIAILIYRLYQRIQKLEEKLGSITGEE
jgi:hypothetical protein